MRDGFAVAGNARGPLMVLDSPLSFWGGVDVQTGKIIDPAHPNSGQSVTGMILVMPHGRGSSSSATVLAETIRLGTGPAALVMDEPDSILITGAFVANALYGAGFPILIGSPPTDRTGVFVVDESGIWRQSDY